MRFLRQLEQFRNVGSLFSYPKASHSSVLRTITTVTNSQMKWTLPIHIAELPIYRSFHITSTNLFKDSVTVNFIDRNGDKISVEADVGDTLLDVAKDNDIDGVEGACGGVLACSTCHCIFEKNDYERLALDDRSEDELDMLDLAYGLTDTSRLVCSVDVTEEMDGIEITVPVATNDARDT